MQPELAEHRKPAYRAPFLCSLVAGFAVLLWYLLIVNGYYGGNWTALFCNARDKVFPPEIERENIYRPASGVGYDGQQYHIVAHDPFFQKGYARYLDIPRVRYERILLPGVAWLAALSRPQWIDPAFTGVTIAFGMAGVWWMSRFAVLKGRPAVLGLAFLTVPAALATLDRFNVDVALCALWAGWVYFWARRDMKRAWLAAAAAGLARETGAALACAAVLSFLFRRDWRKAAIFTASLAPMAAWYAVVAAHTPKAILPTWGWSYPGGWMIDAFLRPQSYPFAPWLAVLIQTLDRAALLAAAAAMVVVVRGLFRRLDPVSVSGAILTFLALAIATAASLDTWQDVFGYGRYVSPLAVVLLAMAIERGSLKHALPPVLVSARVGFPLGSLLIRSAANLVK